MKIKKSILVICSALILISIISVVFYINKTSKKEIKSALFLKHKIYDEWNMARVYFVIPGNVDDVIEYIEFPEVNSEKINIIGEDQKQIDYTADSPYLLSVMEKLDERNKDDDSSIKSGYIYLNEGEIKLKDGKTLLDKTNKETVTLTKIRYKMKNQSEIYEQNIGEITFSFSEGRNNPMDVIKVSQDKYKDEKYKSLGDIENNLIGILSTASEDITMESVDKRSLQGIENMYDFIVTGDYLTENSEKVSFEREVDREEVVPYKIENVKFPISIEKGKPINLYIRANDKNLSLNKNYDYVEEKLRINYINSNGEKGYILFGLPKGRALINNDLLEKLSKTVEVKYE